ncbi:antitoxin Xre/MbcA/ParS toxin-binding domain-containing protein [Puia sp. P3]|uniref:antitoxin Xre/MbcA/ParS toxin-binding domain-containing protein n=1 Tax=Puia sp. P3 TaxID=3423952 RepID=UPI003D670931
MEKAIKQSLYAVRSDKELKDLNDVNVLVYMDNNSIDAGYLKAIKKLTRFTDDNIARWLHISPRTLRNYKPEKVLDKKLSEQVIMLRTVFEKGRAVLGNAEAFDKWLGTPNYFFDRKEPLDFLDTTSGMRYLFDRLTAMEYGDNV